MQEYLLLNYENGQGLAGEIRHCITDADNIFIDHITPFVSHRPVLINIIGNISKGVSEYMMYAKNGVCHGDILFNFDNQNPHAPNYQPGEIVIAVIDTHGTNSLYNVFFSYDIKGVSFMGITADEDEPGMYSFDEIIELVFISKQTVA